MDDDRKAFVEETPIYWDSFLLKVALFLGTAQLVEAFFS